MAKANWKSLITGAIAVAGVGAVAVYVVKMLRARSEDVDGAIDDMLDLYKSKAAELDRLIEPDLRIAN